MALNIGPFAPTRQTWTARWRRWRGPSRSARVEHASTVLVLFPAARALGAQAQSELEHIIRNHVR